MLKTIGWNAVSILSLFHWDGISITSETLENVCCYSKNVQTYSPDESTYKSIFPISTMIVMFYIIKNAKTKTKSSGDFDDD